MTMKTVDDYGMEVIAILEFNGCALPLSDDEVRWVTLCYIHKDRPDECAFGIADTRDSLAALATQPWTHRLVAGGRWEPPHGGRTEDSCYAEGVLRAA